MKYLTSVLVLICFACSNEPKKEIASSPEKSPMAYSLMDEPFYEPDRNPKQQAKLDSNLQVAQNNFNTEPSELNYIWLGRRTAYLSRYGEAIEIYTKGIEAYPDSYRLYRHRGHRYISMRRFDKAIEDFQKAVEHLPKDTIETEPDGIPNSINQPLSSTQFNVWYHLGLAYYLKGDFEKAAEAYEECMKISNNDDLLVATTDWLYMTYKRLSEDEKADELLEKITANMEIVENDSYFQRLMMYKGDLTPGELLSVDETSADYDLALATQGYGVGNYYLTEGDTVKGKEVLTSVRDGKHWAAFGYIAAEADLHRMNNSQ